LFALITNGILTQKLPWILVLLGVSIAIVVELCGVSSLAFAVGVYLPLSTSAPIFVGGMVRYFVERRNKVRKDQPTSEAESEMSPGSLLSTGYIAGGTIGGVLIAFLNFSDTTVKTLAMYQYRTAPITSDAPFDVQCEILAQEELGTNSSDQQRRRLADEVRELNEPELRRYATVPKGITLTLPKSKHYEATANAYLFQVAQQALGDEDKASLLFDLNESQLKLPDRLPNVANLKIPQRNLPAIVVFALLAVFLVAVGKGWALKQTET
jgi:hypothetical protein